MKKIFWTIYNYGLEDNVVYRCNDYKECMLAFQVYLEKLDPKEWGYVDVKNTVEEE